MFRKVGFIGAGNIASAMIQGIINSSYIKARDIYISNIHKDKADLLAARFKANAADNNIDLVKKSDVIVLSVKPDIYKSVLNEIRDVVTEDKLIVTVAAGITIDYVKGFLKKNIKVVRTIPNTPVLVGEGMIIASYAPPVDGHDMEFIKNMLSGCGMVEIMENEELMDAVTALCSSGPAFIDMLIEAMADAAVYLGLPRDKSYVMASQTILGTSMMVIETKEHPGKLKDMVCSPKGTTIEGVRVLEEKGFRSAIIEAIIATCNKAKKLSEQ